MGRSAVKHCIIRDYMKCAMQIVFLVRSMHGIKHQYSADISARLDNNWKYNVLLLNLLKYQYSNNLRLANMWLGSNSLETLKFPPTGEFPLVGNP